MEPTIVSARITNLPHSILSNDPLPEVFATFDDGEEWRLFEYYPDEVRFGSEEFIGLTKTQAHELRSKRYGKTFRS